MHDKPVMKFKSRIEGKNADVAIYPDRVEWSLTKLGRSRAHSTEMMPIRNVSSVTSKKDGLRHTEVVLVATGNTVEFRLPHGQAHQAKDVLQRLMLGEDVAPVAVVDEEPGGADDNPAEVPTPSPVPTLASPPPAPAAAAGAPAPPPPPPGWHADPHGRHEHRFWDGTSWTEHVSDAGVQSTDSPG